MRKELEKRKVHGFGQRLVSMQLRDGYEELKFKEGYSIRCVEQYDIMRIQEWTWCVLANYWKVSECRTRWRTVLLSLISGSLGLKPKNTGNWAEQTIMWHCGESLIETEIQWRLINE